MHPRPDRYMYNRRVRVYNAIEYSPLTLCTPPTQMSRQRSFKKYRLRDDRPVSLGRRMPFFFLIAVSEISFFATPAHKIIIMGFVLPQVTSTRTVVQNLERSRTLPHRTDRHYIICGYYSYYYSDNNEIRYFLHYSHN